MKLHHKLFLTTALALTTMVGGYSQKPNDSAENNTQKNKTEHVNEATTVAPKELVKIVRGDNANVPYFVDIDISEAMGLETGRRFARYFNGSDKPGEYLNKFGPFHPDTYDTQAVNYIDNLEKAAKETYKKVKPFLDKNKKAFQEAFERGVTEIDYSRQQVTYSFPDGNMTVDYDDNTICDSEFSYMRAGFIPKQHTKPKSLDYTSPDFKAEILEQVKDVLEIGRQTNTQPSRKNTYKQSF